MRYTIISIALYASSLAALSAAVPAAAQSVSGDVGGGAFCAAVMPDCDESGNVIWPVSDPSSPCHLHYASICLRTRLDEALNEGALCESDLQVLKKRERSRKRRRRAGRSR